MKKAAMAAVAGLVVLVGCGGGASGSVASLSGSSRGSGGGHTTTTASQATVLQLYHEWAQCMRQHGVQMADPTITDQGGVDISASGVSASTFQAANTACDSLHQAAQRANGGGGTTQKPDPTKLLNFSKCMRAHGLRDFPDPGPSGGIQLQGGPNSDMNPNNPTFQKAQKACQSILGSPKGGERIQISGGGGGPGAVANGGGKG
jgi:hypothetical protein